MAQGNESFAPNQTPHGLSEHPERDMFVGFSVAVWRAFESAKLRGFTGSKVSFGGELGGGSTLGARWLAAARAA